ncbi:MAG TPA: heavy metal translocating P-type ATPase [Erysipelotrichaceae bacterium]|nr:heavy metal translocating P-type ATPase [Erysipelotrichaceae bacterium]
MQRFILSKKNEITFISGILLIIALINQLTIKNHDVLLASLVIASIIGIAPIFIQAFSALRVKVVSIDLLVTIAVIAAFMIQNFEESAIVTFLFLFGAYLEQKTLSKTRSAIKELTEMAPETALKFIDEDNFIEVDIDDVEKGDMLLVRTGGKIPVDGKVVFGSGSVNEASITGEPIPVEKDLNDGVFAGSILENGTIRIITNRVGEDTTFGKIIELVEEAQDSKSEAERFIDNFAKYYTPAVLVLSLLVYIITRDIELSITVLVLGCPGALVIGVPVSNVSGIGNGAKNGILLKGSEVISDFSKLDVMVFDKTGTVTQGNPTVVKTMYYDKSLKAKSLLASVEEESEHPLAKAVLSELGKTDIYLVTDTEVVKGFGIIANVENHRVVVGNIALMEKEDVVLSSDVRADLDDLLKLQTSLVLCAIDGELSIIMGVSDPLRENVVKDIKKLKALGVKELIMLSGDNQAVVDVVSRELNLDQAYGEMLPEDKADFVKELKASGKTVAFIGDGINDSPSLAFADVAIAMGSGSDVAIETSDVVLMNSNFSTLPHALGLSKAIYRNMMQNIVIAVGVVLLLLTGLFMSDWVSMSVGMLVHEASILVVILNGMRLINYKLK